MHTLFTVAAAIQDDDACAGGANMNDRPEDEPLDDGAEAGAPPDELTTLEATLSMKRLQALTVRFLS